MGLLERINASRQGETRSSVDSWISDYLIPASTFSYNGVTYPLGASGSLAGQRAMEISQTLPSYMSALAKCPPAFAAELVRALVLSQARFTFRNPPWHPRTPRRTFGNASLGILERPWTNATTGELVSRMEWHAGLAGNAYAAYRGRQLKVLRPDWVGVLSASDAQPDDPDGALDSQIIAYLYWNLGPNGGYKPDVLLPDEVAHWSPIPDPLCPNLGMSWLTPAIRDIQVDRMAADYKVLFYQQGATPNLVVKGIPAATKEQFDDVVEMLEERHSGAGNAFRTLYLTAGADATVIGSNLQQMDMKALTASGETRISVLSRVPASLLGISEGLAGSALNAGNFSSARRSFADTWVYPTLQDLAASLAPLVKVPADAELWFDTVDMPLLREDALDAANITSVNAATIANLVKEGFTPESAVAAVKGQDMSLLVHTGLVSVQLQSPGIGQQDSDEARNLVEMVQKVYLGVGSVLTADEAREILNRAGGHLNIPAPPLGIPSTKP